MTIIRIDKNLGRVELDENGVRKTYHALAGGAVRAYWKNEIRGKDRRQQMSRDLRPESQRAIEIMNLLTQTE